MLRTCRYRSLDSNYAKDLVGVGGSGDTGSSSTANSCHGRSDAEIVTFANHPRS